MKFQDYTEPTITDPKDYKVYHAMSTGDSINDLGYSLDSPMAIDEYLDTLQDVGITRVYWRGLQQAVLVNQLTVRPEGNVRMLFRALMGDSMYWEGSNYGGPTIDQYLVQEAHKRGMKVIGMTTLADFGAPGDSTLTRYPYAHYSFHWEHPEWSPVDEWGIMKQGGPVDFSYEEARKYVIDLTMEEVKRAGYDGVIFISYSENHDLKYDDQFGYNDPAVEEFKRRYGVTPEQDNLWYKVSMDHWRKLRGEYLTQFLREMKEALVEYDPDAILALYVSASKPRQQEVWFRYFDSHVCNNMYMDYETYVQEGIVDELHIKGNTDMQTHIKMIEDMLWLCRGTDTEVVIQTSAVNLEAVGFYDYWTPYMQRGVAIEFFYSGPNGPIANDHTIYQYGLDISDKIGTMSEESQFRYKVARVAMGKETATVEQLTQWLRMKDSVTVPRMAMHALATYHTEAAAPLLKEALTYDEIGVRGAALKYLILYKLVTPDMAQAIIDNVDKDNSMGTYWLSGPALHTNASAYKDVLWKAFADPESSLRTKVIAMEGRDGLALTEEQVAQLHEVVTGDAFKTEYDDIYDTDHEKAVEASYKSYIRYYSMNLMYHAARCGSVSAKEHLIDYAKSDDTVVSTMALDYVGDAAAGQFFNAEQEAKAVEALDEVFARLSSKSGYTYDGDFKQWAYRPVGHSLLKLGDAGKAVMQKYYVGDDPELALYAFKCMYMPQDENNVTLMDYDEYKAAYEHLPRILTSCETLKLEQAFGI